MDIGASNNGDESNIHSPTEGVSGENWTSRYNPATNELESVGITSGTLLQDSSSMLCDTINGLEPLSMPSRLSCKERIPREDITEVLPKLAERILHHVIPATYGADNRVLAAGLAGFNRRRGGFLYVTYHTRALTECGHYHVVHACSTPNRCRCFDYGFGTVFKRRDYKTYEEIDNLSLEHWRNLYLYLAKGHGYR